MTSCLILEEFLACTQVYRQQPYKVISMNFKFYDSANPLKRHTTNSSMGVQFSPLHKDATRTHSFLQFHHISIMVLFLRNTKSFMEGNFHQSKYCPGACFCTNNFSQLFIFCSDFTFCGKLKLYFIVCRFSLSSVMLEIIFRGKNVFLALCIKLHYRIWSSTSWAWICYL